jgi:hypothetical protein
MSEFNVKQFHQQNGLSATKPFAMNGYKCTLLKPRNGFMRVNVQHKQSNIAKTVQLKPKLQGGKLFDWDPIIDGASVIGDLIAPELAPFFHMGKTALKHWLKKDKKETHVKKEHKHKEHGSNFDKAFDEGVTTRSMQPPKVRDIEDIVKHEIPKYFVHPNGDADVKLPHANQIEKTPGRNGPIFHVVAHDGKRIALNDYMAWRSTRTKPKITPHGNVQPLQNRRTFTNAVVQDNLREIINRKVSPSKVITPEDKPALKMDDFALINPHSKLSASNVPLLNGEMATEMDMTPVTIVKTENHAIIAGSELLGDLVVPAGAGVAGGCPLVNLINPRLFIGTKLAIEAQTWLMYRFRKFIIEYIPTINANIGGAFIEYFTQDPYENTLTGLAQRRNAMEHDHAVPFQPFSYVVAGMGAKEQDKTLYYMSAEDGTDERLVYQSKYVLTNNAQVADITTVLSYGSLVIHYECDFYYPALPTGTASGNYGQQTFGGLSFVTGDTITLTSTTLVYPGVEPGWIVTAVAGPGPAGSAACYFDKPDPSQTTYTVGSTYFLRCSLVSGTDVTFQVFDQLNYALAPQSVTTGRLRAGSAVSAGTWPLGNVNRLDPVLFSRQSLAKIEEEEESDSSSDELVSQLEKIRLSESEKDLVKIKRRIAPIALDTLPGDFNKMSLHAKRDPPTKQ